MTKNLGKDSKSREKEIQKTCKDMSDGARRGLKEA